MRSPRRRSSASHRRGVSGAPPVSSTRPASTVVAWRQASRRRSRPEARSARARRAAAVAASSRGTQRHLVHSGLAAVVGKVHFLGRGPSQPRPRASVPLRHSAWPPPFSVEQDVPLDCWLPRSFEPSRPQVGRQVPTLPAREPSQDRPRRLNVPPLEGTRKPHTLLHKRRVGNLTPHSARWSLQRSPRCCFECATARAMWRSRVVDAVAIVVAVAAGSADAATAVLRAVALAAATTESAPAREPELPTVAGTAPRWCPTRSSPRRMLRTLARSLNTIVSPAGPLRGPHHRCPSARPGVLARSCKERRERRHQPRR
mmetsp:Transcript_38523/g.102476  ORF Transcript_38523/g.102476 Transcript_38523/m.102476 type:complete len:315 (-) Transcript_38523:208-1152(-)